MMKKAHFIFILLLSSTIAKPQLPVDAEGWTIIEPSVDSRFIYVSSSEGDDNNSGFSDATPVKSIDKAKSLARNGYPDYILFKRGDVWKNEAFGYFISGRSESEPLVISYYGDSGNRPLFKLLTPIIYNTYDNLKNIAIIGLEFYGYTRDPGSPDFSTSKRLTAIHFEGGAKGENILLEDCVARYVQIAAFSNNDQINVNMFNIKLRRCIAFGAYAENSCCVHANSSRAQGIYLASVDGFIAEDCLFDHNGWNPDVESASRNMYNHNFYMQDKMKGYIRLSNNIIARGASHGVQGRSGAILENNLFVQNALAGFISGNPNYPGFQADSFRVEWNVVLEGVRMNKDIAQSEMVSAAVSALEAKDKYEGTEMSLTNNIAAHRIDEGTNRGIKNNSTDGIIRENNINYKWDPRLDMFESNWLDPEVSLGSYHASLGKEGTTEAFLEVARKRPIKTWWPEYSASAVNDYIRMGFSYQKDTVPPHAPIVLIPSVVLSHFVKITWPVAMDNIRVSDYKVFLNDQQANTEKWMETGYEFQNLVPETEYTLKVVSLDASGNESRDTATLVIMTKAPDTEAPTVPGNIVCTANGGNYLTFSWFHSSDNFGIITYNIYLDSNQQNTEPVKDTSFKVDGLAELTEYTINLQAVDAVGNMSELSGALIIKTSDITKPSTPGNISYSRGSGDTLIISWDASTDNGEVSGYNIYIDNQKINNTPVDVPYKLPFSAFDSGDRIRITAIDSYGNESFKSSSIELILTSINMEAGFGWVKVYPNPANDMLSIESPKEMNKIKIYDLQGKLVLTMDPGKSQHVIISTQQFKQGQYLLQIGFDNHKMSTVKFIKN